jgi:hypothetical protein
MLENGILLKRLKQPTNAAKPTRRLHAVLVRIWCGDALMWT